MVSAASGEWVVKGVCAGEVVGDCIISKVEEAADYKTDEWLINLKQ